jgi:hypothetical protein
MWDRSKSIRYLVSNAQPHSLGYCARYVREAIEAGGVILVRHASAKDYGPSLTKVGFRSICDSNSLKLYRHQSGDVAVIQPIVGSPDGHMCMFGGTYWTSDFVQYHGVYPGPTYRKLRPAFSIFGYPFIFDSIPSSNTARLV